MILVLFNLKNKKVEEKEIDFCILLSLRISAIRNLVYFMETTNKELFNKKVYYVRKFKFLIRIIRKSRRL